MARYIKTETTEFEQFDGSNEMCEKYGIRPDMETKNVVTGIPMFYSILTHEGEMFFEVGAWIATGVDDEHYAVEDEIFKKTYKKLPVIPKCVADLMPDWKAHVLLQDVYFHVGQYHSLPALDEAKADLWVVQHDDQFARAWLDGYEVEDDTKNDNCI